MPKSKKRVKKSPTPRPPRTPPKPRFADEDDLLHQMTESTLTRVLEGLKLVRKIQAEHNPKHGEMLVEAYEIASLALTVALDEMKSIWKIEGLTEMESAYEKVKILSANNIEELLQNVAT